MGSEPRFSGLRESQILWSCFPNPERNPERKRASHSWGGLPGLLSEEFPRATAVFKLKASPAKCLDSSRKPAGGRETSVLSGRVSQLASGAHKRGCSAPSRPSWTAREPSGSTCGLIGSRTWESAHSLNERGKKKNSLQMPTSPSPHSDLHGGSGFWDHDSAPTRCAVCSCWPLLAGGTRDGRASGTVRLRQPQTFIVPPLLAAPLFLPPSQAFFIFFSTSLQPSFLSFLPSSSLLSLCFIILED